MSRLAPVQSVFEAAPRVEELEVYYTDDRYSDSTIVIEAVSPSFPGSFSEAMASTHVYARHFTETTDWVFDSLHATRSTTQPCAPCARIVTFLNQVAEGIQDHVNSLSGELTEAEAILYYNPTAPFVMFHPDPDTPRTLPVPFALASGLSSFRSNILCGVQSLVVHRRFRPATHHAMIHRARLRAVAAAAPQTTNTISRGFTRP